MANKRNIERCIKLVQEEKFEDAFDYANAHDVFMEEDWEEINGVEYYTVAVEDELFRFEMD